MMVDWNFEFYNEFGVTEPERTDLLSVWNAALLFSSGECNLSMLFCFLNSGNQDGLQGGHDHRRIPARDITAEELNTRNITRSICHS
jgi:hypothetical protein